MRSDLPLRLLLVSTAGVLWLETPARPWAITVPFEAAAKFDAVSVGNGEAPTSAEVTFPAIERKEGQLPVWHAGGMKITSDSWGAVEWCEVARNSGSGIWFDYADSDQPIVIQRNYIHDNGPKGSGANCIQVKTTLRYHPCHVHVLTIGSS